MTDWMYIVAYLILGALMVMMAIGIAFSAFMPALDRWNKRYFIILFSLLVFSAFFMYRFLPFSLYLLGSPHYGSDVKDRLSV